MMNFHYVQHMENDAPICAVTSENYSGSSPKTIRHSEYTAYKAGHSYTLKKLEHWTSECSQLHAQSHAFANDNLCQ